MCIDYRFGTCLVCSIRVYASKARLFSHKRRNCKVSPQKKAFFQEDHVVSAAVLTRTKSKEMLELVKPSSSSSSFRHYDQNKSKSTPDVLQKSIVKVNKSQETKIDAAIAILFFCTGTAFRKVDSTFFKSMVYELNPAFSPLLKSSKTLAGNQLSTQHASMNELLREKIKASHGYVLVSDGWTSLRTEHLLNFIILLPNEKPLYYKSVDTRLYAYDGRRQNL